MKTIIKLIALALATLFTTTSYAHGKGDYEHTDTQKINETFKVSENVKLNIDNIFGDIVIVEGNQNEVIIDVTIEISANSEREFQKLLDAIEVDISKSGNEINILTILGEYRNIINKNNSYRSSENMSVSIDYNITAPKDYSPTIVNKFGKIKLDEVTGDADIEIEFGVLSINKANNLTLDSEFSKVYIKEVNAMDIDKFSFGLLDISTLNKSLACDEIEFSKFNIDDCSDEIEKIEIDAEFTPINITIPETVIIKSSLRTEFGKVTNKHSGRMTTANYDAEVDIKNSFAGIRIYMSDVDAKK